MARDLTWYEYDMAHYDALPPKVRAAVRYHSELIDCDLLTGLSERAAIKAIKAGKANAPACSDRCAADAFEAAQHHHHTGACARG